MQPVDALGERERLFVVMQQISSLAEQAGSLYAQLERKVRDSCHSWCLRSLSVNWCIWRLPADPLHASAPVQANSASSNASDIANDLRRMQEQAESSHGERGGRPGPQPCLLLLRHHPHLLSQLKAFSSGLAVFDKLRTDAQKLEHLKARQRAQVCASQGCLRARVWAAP